MFQAQCRIISNDRINRKYYLMRIRAPLIAKKAKAGQFVSVRCDEAAVFLRRPFSFHSIDASRFQILYEVVGKGTRSLANKRPGEALDVLGPLGNGFEIPRGLSGCILVAGGIGVAPLFALAQAVAASKAFRRGGHIRAIIGARSKGELLCEKEFRRLGVETTVATDDGSRGRKAFATELFEEMLKERKDALPTIYACGPEAMLKEVSRIARKRGLRCYASLEENIACGVGACLGCAVKTKAGYKLVCKDGPVFDINEVAW